MPAPGFDADPEELRQAASTLRESTSEIQALSDYTKEADPDIEAWGLCGLVLAPVYFGIAELYRFGLSEFTEAINGVADGISASGESYAGADDEISSAMTSLESEIDGGGGGSR